jgi:F-type H+-transporting ATPase subunit a
MAVNEGAEKPAQSKVGVYVAIGATLALIIFGLLGPIKAQEPHVQLAAEVLFNIGGFKLTNTMIGSWMSMILLIVFFVIASRRVQMIPGGLQNFVEFLLESLLNFAELVAGPERARKFFSIAATFFLFVIVSNWLGLLPGFGPIGIYHDDGKGHLVFAPLFRAATTDLNVTLGLALISVALTQVYGVQALGFFSYLGRFLNFRRGLIPALVGLLEIVSETAKLISFSFRLFGNIFAGEVLLVVVASLVPLVVVVPFYGLEVIVGFFQAFVFAALTLIFMSIATTSHDDHHEEHAGS